MRLPPPPGAADPSPDDARTPHTPAAPMAVRQYVQEGPGAAGRPAGGSAPRTWMNVTAFVSGLLCFTSITAVIAIVLGHMGVAASKRGQANARMLGLIGLTLGYVWIGLLFLGVLARVAY